MPGMQVTSRVVEDLLPPTAAPTLSSSASNTKVLQVASLAVTLLGTSNVCHWTHCQKPWERACTAARRMLSVTPVSGVRNVQLKPCWRDPTLRVWQTIPLAALPQKLAMPNWARQSAGLMLLLLLVCLQAGLLALQEVAALFKYYQVFSSLSCECGPEALLSMQF